MIDASVGHLLDFTHEIESLICKMLIAPSIVSAIISKHDSHKDCVSMIATLLKICVLKLVHFLSNFYYRCLTRSCFPDY